MNIINARHILTINSDDHIPHTQACLDDWTILINGYDLNGMIFRQIMEADNAPVKGTGGPYDAQAQRKGAVS